VSSRPLLSVPADSKHTLGGCALSRLGVTGRSTTSIHVPNAHTGLNHRVGRRKYSKESDRSKKGDYQGQPWVWLFKCSSNGTFSLNHPTKPNNFPPPPAAGSLMYASGMINGNERGGDQQSIPRCGTSFHRLLRCYCKAASRP